MKGSWWPSRGLTSFWADQGQVGLIRAAESCQPRGHSTLSSPAKVQVSSQLAGNVTAGLLGLGRDCWAPRLGPIEWLSYPV